MLVGERVDHESGRKGRGEQGKQIDRPSNLVLKQWSDLKGQNFEGSLEVVPVTSSVGTGRLDISFGDVSDASVTVRTERSTQRPPTR